MSLADIIMPNPADWIPEAACLDRPDLDWFAGLSEGGHGGSRETTAMQARTRQVCFSCPVAIECVTEGIAINDGSGMRGGLVGDERKHLRTDVRKGRDLIEAYERRIARYVETAA